MWILILIAIAALAASGKTGQTGVDPMLPTEPPSEWIANGIAFRYEPATDELTATHSQTLTGAPGGSVVEVVGYFATAELAHAASLGWMPFSEGEGATPGQKPAAQFFCQTVKLDGEFRICLYRQKHAKWGYRATDGAGTTIATGGGFPSKTDATVDAWLKLLPFPTSVVLAPDTRYGVTLMPDGSLDYDATPANAAAWNAKAIAAWQTELDKGEDDTAGLLLTVFGSIWPNVNLLRLTPYGQTLAEVAERVEPFKNDAAAAVSRIFVAQAGIATNPNDGGAQEPAAPVVQIALGPSAEILNYAAANGSKWWTVTESGSHLNQSGTELIPWATWRVWGPGTEIVGEPVASGATSLRETATANARVWIENH